LDKLKASIPVLFIWLSVGRSANRQSNEKHNTYQLLYIYIQYASWWWATNMPETCRVWLKK